MRYLLYGLPLLLLLESNKRIVSRTLDFLDAAEVGFVGGGAGGVELALAMRASVGESIPITIVCTMLMPAFYGGVADLVRQAAERRGVEILED